MGLIDAFTPEDKVTVRFLDFYNMMYEAAKAELIENAVRNGVPLKYIRGILDFTEAKEESSRT